MLQDQGDWSISSHMPPLVDLPDTENKSRGEKSKGTEQAPPELINVEYENLIVNPHRCYRFRPDGQPHKTSQDIRNS